MQVLKCSEPSISDISKHSGQPKHSVFDLLFFLLFYRKLFIIWHQEWHLVDRSNQLYLLFQRLRECLGTIMTPEVTLLTESGCPSHLFSKKNLRTIYICIRVKILILWQRDNKQFAFLILIERILKQNKTCLKMPLKS